MPIVGGSGQIAVQAELIDNITEGLNKVDKELNDLQSKRIAGEKAAAQASAAAAKQSSMSWTEFRSAYRTVLDVVRAGEAVYDATIQKNVDYSTSIQELMQISGQGAEATSRFVQVLDDYGLTAQDALVATKALTKQGLTPTTETLAQLSAQYKQLNTSEERNAFILKNLGKGGLEWVRILNLGEDAINRNAAAVNKNLILTEQQIKETEKYRLLIDDTKDSLEGYAIVAGGKFIDAILKGNEAMKEYQRLQDTGVRGAQQLQMLAEEAVRINDASTARMEGLASLYATKDALNAVAEAQKSLYDEQIISVIGAQQNATDAYAKTVADLNQQLAEGKISAEENAAGIAAAGEVYAAAGDKITFTLVQMSLAADGWQASDTDAILSVGVALGQFSQQQANVAASTISNAQAIALAHQQMATSIMAHNPEALAALAGLDQQFLHGMYTAQEYAQKVQAIYTAIRKLDGQSATAFVTIITNGSVPVFKHGGETHTFVGVNQYADGGEIPAYGTGSIVERGSPEILTVGNKSWVVMGNQSGQVTALDKMQSGSSGGSSGGGGGGLSSADLSKIATAVVVGLSKAGIGSK